MLCRCGVSSLARRLVMSGWLGAATLRLVRLARYTWWRWGSGLACSASNGIGRPRSRGLGKVDNVVWVVGWLGGVVWIPGHVLGFCITPIPHCRATVFGGCQGGKDALTTPKNC